MRKNRFLGGMITGAAVGAAMAMIWNPSDPRNGLFSKRNVKKVTRAMTGVVDNVMDMKRSW